MIARTASVAPAKGLAAEDLRLALRAAMLYHVDGLTQVEVAERLGLSRPTAGRLIARARAQGLVKIEVALPDGLVVHADLERRLETTFDLAEAIVVPDAGGNDEVNSVSLGRAAAGLLVRRLQPTHRLGLAWGHTMAAMADALPAGSTRCAEVVQLDGSTSSVGYRTRGEYIINHCADHFEAVPFPLSAPLYADVSTVTSLRKDSLISKTVTRGSKCDIVMFSVGDLSTASTLLSGSLIGPEVLDELIERGAVGDACGRFFRLDGTAVGKPLSARTVSVELDELRRCPVRVLVAGGMRKREAILGALRGDLARVLVTDDSVATWLIGQNASTVEEGSS